MTGPLGTPVAAFFGLLGDGHTAALEMAACAGLPLVPPDQRDPRITTTYGVGELILAALNAGCRHFIIGIGGRLQRWRCWYGPALDAALLTEDGKVLAHGGAALTTLSQISISNMDPRLQECTVRVACDVKIGSVAYWRISRLRPSKRCHT